MDKRKYSDGYLPTPLTSPPACAHEAAHLLTRLFNEASAATPTWAQHAVPRARDTTAKPAPADMDPAHPAVKRVVGTGPWEIVSPTYAGPAPNVVFFFAKGRVHTPLGSAKWYPVDDDRVRFLFCREDTMRIVDSEGTVKLVGRHYTLRLKALPVERRPQVDESTWKGRTAQRLIGSGPWSWANIPVIAFLDQGALHTPWAPGTWQPRNEGADDGRDVVMAEFLGAKCEIEFLPCGRFRSVRLSDGDVVEGSITIAEPVRFRCPGSGM